MFAAVATILALSFVAIGTWMTRKSAGAFPGPGLVVTLPGLYGLAIAATAWAGPFLFRLAADLVEATGWLLPCLSCIVTVRMVVWWVWEDLRSR